MAEMTTLVASIYRNYTTTVAGNFDTVSPGVVSRYELFYDETCDGVKVSISCQHNLPDKFADIIVATTMSH